MRRLRVLEEENRKLKQLVADLSMDKQMLQDVLRKSLRACSYERPRKISAGGLRFKRAPGVPGVTFGRSTCRYEGVAAEQAALRMRLKDLAQARVSYGYRRLHILLQREGWAVNHKRVYRPYRQEGLMLRTKRPKKARVVSETHGSAGGRRSE